MSRAIAPLWLGAGSFLISASSSRLELALSRVFLGLAVVFGASSREAAKLCAAGHKLNACDPDEREDGALDRCRRACRNDLRWPAPVSARRGSCAARRQHKTSLRRTHVGPRSEHGAQPRYLDSQP